MLLNFDIDAPAIAEHDDWHTHEHLPERLSIPGFLRGTRWVALRDAPRYAVLYEVDRLETLGSAAYLERLNNPTPWTSKMMPHYRGMRRGLCSVEGSWGLGLGRYALLARFNVAADQDSSALPWLRERLSMLSSRVGLGSVHLLKGTLAAAMTAEQRLRGADDGVDWALLATGYEVDSVRGLQEGELAVSSLKDRGLAIATCAIYEAVYSLSAGELTR